MVKLAYIRASHNVLIFPVMTILILFKNISNPFQKKFVGFFFVLFSWCLKHVSMY